MLSHLLCTGTSPVKFHPSPPGAREPWRQSRRGSHKILPNGAKTGLGSHKFQKSLYEITAMFSSKNTAVNDFTATSPHIFNRLLLYCRLKSMNGVEIHFDE